MQYISFFTVLKAGVKSMLHEQNYAVASHRMLEEAFARGVLEVKSKIAQDRQPSALPESYVPNLLHMAFPHSGFIRNEETGSLETLITYNMDYPADFGCAELHVFLDGSADGYKHLLDCLRTISNKIPFEDAVVLELMGDRDPRMCSAMLCLYGAKGHQLAHGMAGFLDQRLHKQRQGYPLDILYPPKSKFWSSHCFAEGRYRSRKQELFRRLFMAVYGLNILHMDELLMQFANVQTAFNRVGKA